MMMEWQPIDTAPKDDFMIRWHKIHKCPVAVRLLTRQEMKMLCISETPWLEKTGSNTWPDEAFTPHWSLLPAPPKE